MNNAWKRSLWQLSAFVQESAKRPCAAAILPQAIARCPYNNNSSCCNILTSQIRRAQISPPSLLIHPSCSSLSLSKYYSTKRKSQKSPSLKPKPPPRSFTGHLNSDQIKAIFGNHVHDSTGKDALSTLQNQRETGYIDKSIPTDPKKGLTEQSIQNALTWLRAKFPVDEDEAIMQRLEKEEHEEEERLRRTLQKNPSRPRMYSQPQENVSDDNVYGRVGLDDIREEYKRLEKARLEAEKKKEKEHEKGIVGGLQKPRQRVDLAPREKWWVKYAEKGQITDAKTPPNIPKWEKLWPSGLVTLLVCAASYILAVTYVAPPTSARLWPDTPPAAATIGTLILLNVTIFCLWRIPFNYRFLNKYFTSVPAYPFALSIIGNTFSHISPKHLLLNMVVLFYCGTKLHDEIGRGKFLAVYFSTAVLSSYASLAHAVIFMKLTQLSFGASGAVLGVLACYMAYIAGNGPMNPEVFSLEFPNVELPSWAPYAFISVLMGLDLMAFLRMNVFRDHLAHLSGMAVGLVIGEILKRERRKGEKEEEEAEKEREGRLIGSE